MPSLSFQHRYTIRVQNTKKLWFPAVLERKEMDVRVTNVLGSPFSLASLQRVVTAARVIEHLHHDHLDNGFQGTRGRAMSSTPNDRWISQFFQSSRSTRAGSNLANANKQVTRARGLWWRSKARRRCRAGHAVIMRFKVSEAPRRFYFLRLGT